MMVKMMRMQGKNKPRKVQSVQKNSPNKHYANIIIIRRVQEVIIMPGKKSHKKASVNKQKSRKQKVKARQKAVSASVSQ